MLGILWGISIDMWDFEKFINNKAVIDDQGNELSYRAFDQHCKKLADIIGKRCLVFNLSRNSIGSLIGYAGMLNNRIVPVMLQAGLDYDLLSGLLEEYKPEYVWLPTEDAQKDSWNQCKKIYKDFDYTLLKTSMVEDRDYLYPELAILLTTSGSTGSQKFVRQSYDNIKANTVSIIEYLNITEEERPITVLPMNYTYGLSVINTHLSAGGCILLTDKSLMQKDFWIFVKNYKATSISGVPYTYEMLKKLRFYNMELPFLKTMTQAGGKLSAGLQKEYAELAKETGKKFVIMYGQCEATARMAYLPPEKALVKTGSMGIPVPGGRFELIDSDNEVINIPDQMGELIYYGKNVA